MDNYSPLNNYKYEDKPFTISVLDGFSAPLRWALGAVNIYPTGSSTDKMSNVGRIATVFVLALAWKKSPTLFYISASSLPLKYIFAWGYEEKSKMIAQVEKTKSQEELIQKRMTDFNNHFEQSRWLEAIAAYKGIPKNKMNNMYYDKIKNVCSQIEPKNYTWEEAQSGFQLLNTKDAQPLVFRFIQGKLQTQIECQLFTKNKIHIFIDQSLSACDNKTLKMIYEHILNRFLKVRYEDKFLTQIIKMNLAKDLISHLENKYKNIPSKDPYSLKMWVISLKTAVIEENANSCLFFAFNDRIVMGHVHDLVKTLSMPQAQFKSISNLLDDSQSDAYQLHQDFMRKMDEQCVIPYKNSEFNQKLFSALNTALKIKNDFLVQYSNRFG